MRFVEKSLRRGRRRFEREKHIARARILGRLWVYDTSSQMTREESERQAHSWAMRLYQNRTKCSCWMCGNRRRLRKGNERFNFQEARLRVQTRLDLADWDAA